MYIFSIHQSGVQQRSKSTITEKLSTITEKLRKQTSSFFLEGKRLSIIMAVRLSSLNAQQFI
jgi:hypothetical protein